MLAKTIEFVDFDGVKRKETHYFNLSKAEIMEMELSIDGGFAEKLTKMIDSINGPEIMRTFKELIMKSYGKKSDDGRRFIKDPELTKEFMETEAYSEFFMELCTDAKAAANFVNNIVPSDVKLDDDAISKIENRIN